MAKPKTQPHMDCLVVGGVADGVLLRKVRLDADVINLSRPTYLKPLESSTQEQPEAAKETEDYQVYSQVLDNGGKTPPIQVGIAVPVNVTMWEGFSQIIVRYVQAATREIIEREENKPRIQ